MLKCVQISGVDLFCEARLRGHLELTSNRGRLGSELILFKTNFRSARGTLGSWREICDVRSFMLVVIKKAPSRYLLLAKIIEKLLWLVLPDENCLMASW